MRSRLFFSSLLALIPWHAAPAADPPGWKLVWGDEFDGRALDPKNWAFDIGNGFYDPKARQWFGGWGNDELEYYTDRPENASLEGGMLHIRARKEPHEGYDYTSARLKTRRPDRTPLFAPRYGRIEFRARLPTGQGIWPAVWMLPADETTYGGWAASGEIDILEARGQEPTKVLGTLHYGGRWPKNVHASGEFHFPPGQSFADFHTYALEWEPGRMRWFVDGQPYQTQTFWWSSAKTANGQGAAPANESEMHAWPAPFDRPFYLVMNLAVGGKFLGNPDASTPFPAEMVVDYVRVYEKVGGPGSVAPRGPGALPFAR